MTTARTSDLWWKNAVIYCLDVETFLDWDGDGRGDLAGLTERVDYLAGMGISCIWLMPFQPSPNRDDGYDITDYYAVDGKLGSLGDFVAFIRTARDRGMRVIVDLVVNHTSDRHPWFRAARSSRASRFRDFYVWSDDPPPTPASALVFPGAEDSIWAYDDRAGQWYLHHFYSHQPDLNVSDPQVRGEIAKIVGFWLQLGVDGFRVDAVPFLIETDGVPGAELDPHDVLRDLRAFVSRRRGDAVLLGEVNLPHKDLRGVLRRIARRRAAHVLRLHPHAVDLPRPGPPRRQAPPEGDRAAPVHPRGVAVGRVRTQPRRAHPRQADRGRAPGGVRRLRARTVDAAVRPGPAPAAPADARRRSGSHPARLQPAVLAPGHTRALLRRGDRDGREPRRAGPAVGPHPDAVDRRAQRRVLVRRGVPPAPPRDPGPVRPAGGERGRPAARPRIAAQLVRAGDPPPAGDARVRLGGGLPARHGRRRRRARPPPRLGLQRRRRPPQPQLRASAREGPSRGHGRHLPNPRPARRRRRPTAGPSRAGHQARRVRVPLAAAAVRGEPDRPLTPAPPRPPWWRHAVIYQVYVRSFADSDGDGMGDLPGVRSRLGYVHDLGVDAIWLNPFYPSPQADAGYDVSDYCGVDPRFGTLADFDALVRDAHTHGLRVIIDLVPNHTSDQHPWFAAALASGPGSPERRRYIFRSGPEPPNDWQSVFGGSAWSRAGGEWYLHLFAPEQPDLNWANPEVQADFDAILRFWLDRGVDGFRIDVAHGMVKQDGMPDIAGAYDSAGPAHLGHPHWDRDEVHAVFRRWRRIADSYGRDVTFVGEAWVQSPHRLARYVRPGELHTAFNFNFLLAPWDAESLREVIDQSITALSAVGAPPTWVLSNHDVVRHATRYGSLARARAATLLMLGLPGGAYLYQGEELGLTQVTDLAPEVLQDPAVRRRGAAQGRDGARVPMPWSGEEPPFGFSEATRAWLPQPPGWRALTAERQAADPSSTLNWYRRALRRRRDLALGDTPLEWCDAPDGMLAFRRRPAFACVVNVGDEPRPSPVRGDVLLASGPLDPGGVLPGATAVWFRP